MRRVLGSVLLRSAQFAVVSTMQSTKAALISRHSQHVFRGIAPCALLSRHVATRSSRHSSSSSSSTAQLRCRTSELDEAGLQDGLPPLAQVYTRKLDVDIDQLRRWVEKKKLNLRPEYQRGMVWDLKTASQLVVTVLEGRIMPPIFLEEDVQGKYLVMDGKQRLTSLLAFMEGSHDIGSERWASAPVQLDINEEECHPSWKGVKFVGLSSSRQENFQNYMISCIVIEKQTDRDVVFSIYRDINSGGVKHSAQQIRKVAFHGAYARMLDRLARNEDFLRIQSRNEPDSDKEIDRELILRFFAMRRSRSEFATPMWKFLNAEMKEFRNAADSQLSKLEDMFCKTAATVWTLFGPDACRDVADTSSRRTTSSRKQPQLDVHLWDAVMVAVCEELQSPKREKELRLAKDEIQARFKQLLQDKEFRTCLNSRSKKYAVERVQQVQRMLQDATQTRRLDNRRAFDPNIKQQLINMSRASRTALMCAVCNQRIEDWELRTAEVDHITPWSRGGQTVLSNAQLLHMRCNRSKSNRVHQAAFVAQ